MIEFLGTERKEVHGEMVDVKIYRERTEPTINLEALLAEVCGASAARTAEIRREVERYVEETGEFWNDIDEEEEQLLPFRELIPRSARDIVDFLYYGRNL